MKILIIKYLGITFKIFFQTKIMKTITEALDLEMIMTTPSDGQLWGADDYENGSFTGKGVHILTVLYKDVNFKSLNKNVHS